MPWLDSRCGDKEMSPLREKINGKKKKLEKKKTKQNTHTQIGRQEEEIKGRLLEKIEEINLFTR